MSIPEYEALHDLAQQHANRTAADINNAMTRGEHIRLTQTASEAATLLHAIELLRPANEPQQPAPLTYGPTHL